MRGRERRRRAGFLLPLAVTLSFLLLMLGYSLSSLSRGQLTLANARVRAAKVQAAADGGLTLALLALAADPNGYAGAKATTLSEGPETYEISVQRSGTLPDGQSIPSGCVYLASVGRLDKMSPRTSGALVRLGTTTSAGLKGLRGALANTIYLSNGASIDSYNSSVGAYSKSKGKNGAVATNSADTGVVRILGGANIYGPVAVGPGGTLEAKKSSYNVGQKFSIWYDWGTTVGTMSVMDKPITIPEVSMPSVGTKDASFNWSNKEIPVGSYRDVTVSNGANLSLSPGTYVFRKLILTGGAQISLAGNGPVKIFVSEKFELSNGVKLSDSSVKSSLLQINLAKGADFTHSGGAEMTGVVYAPQVDIDMSNAATIYGAVVGKSINMSGSAAIRYDEALQDITLAGDSGSSSGSSGSNTVLFRQRL